MSVYEPDEPAVPVQAAAHAALGKKVIETKKSAASERICLRRRTLESYSISAYPASDLEQKAPCRWRLEQKYLLVLARQRYLRRYV